MSLWGASKPPKNPNPKGQPCVATQAGWIDPVTSEIIAAGNFADKSIAQILAVAFGASSYNEGDNLSVSVRFSELVNVPAGEHLTVHWTGSGGDIVLYAAAQNAVQNVIFNKQSDHSTPQALPQGAHASATLTSDLTNVSDGDTVTIGSKVYTFQSVLTNVDGHVAIGGSYSASLTNLFHAINHSGGVPGTDYALATVANSQVTATNPSASTVVITAINFGTAGNSIATTETSSHLSWGGSVMSGGTNLPGTLSVAAQSLIGTIHDAAGANPASSLVISSGVASAAGTRVVS